MKSLSYGNLSLNTTFVFYGILMIPRIKCLTSVGISSRSSQRKDSTAQRYVGIFARYVYLFHDELHNNSRKLIT